MKPQTRLCKSTSFEADQASASALIPTHGWCQPPPFFLFCGRQISCQIFEDESPLHGCELQPVTGHLINRCVPSFLVTSINGYHFNVVTTSTLSFNQIAVRTLRQDNLRGSPDREGDKRAAQDANEHTSNSHHHENAIHSSLPCCRITIPLCQDGTAS